MRKRHSHLSIAYLALILAAIFSSQDAVAEEGACYLRAAHGDVYLRVFDVDSKGNMGALIWQGRINQGQTARLRTSHAYFRYFYNSAPEVDQPFRGGVDKACNDADTVDVP